MPLILINTLYQNGKTTYIDSTHQIWADSDECLQRRNLLCFEIFKKWSKNSVGENERGSMHLIRELPAEEF